MSCRRHNCRCYLPWTIFSTCCNATLLVKSLSPFIKTPKLAPRHSSYPFPTHPLQRSSTPPVTPLLSSSHPFFSNQTSQSPFPSRPCSSTAAFVDVTHAEHVQDCIISNDISTYGWLLSSCPCSPDH
jgi:hypothetical protein